MNPRLAGASLSSPSSSCTKRPEQNGCLIQYPPRTGCFTTAFPVPYGDGRWRWQRGAELPPSCAAQLADSRGPRRRRAPTAAAPLAAESARAHLSCAVVICIDDDEPGGSLESACSWLGVYIKIGRFLRLDNLGFLRSVRASPELRGEKLFGTHELWRVPSCRFLQRVHNRTARLLSGTQGFGLRHTTAFPTKSFWSNSNLSDNKI